MITKQNTRYKEAVPSEMRLVVTFRYMATGNSFTALTYLLRFSKEFVSSGVLRVIIKRLEDYVEVKYITSSFIICNVNMDFVL